MKRAIYVFGIIFALGIGVRFRAASTPVASAQIEKWIAPTSTTKRFELSEIQGLPSWTAAYVFGPYTSSTTIDQTLGFKWREAEQFDLESRDDVHLAIFVSGSSVVHVEVWERDNFDCGSTVIGRALAPTTVIHFDRSKPLRSLMIAEPDASFDQ